MYLAPKSVALGTAALLAVMTSAMPVRWEGGGPSRRGREPTPPPARNERNEDQQPSRSSVAPKPGPVRPGASSSSAHADVPEEYRSVMHLSHHFGPYYGPGKQIASKEDMIQEHENLTRGLHAMPSAVWHKRYSAWKEAAGRYGLHY